MDSLKDKTSDNNVHWDLSDDVFCPHSAPTVKEEAVTGENTILRRASHFLRYKHVFNPLIQMVKFGNARQERVNSDQTAKMEASYENARNVVESHYGDILVKNLVQMKLSCLTQMKTRGD